MKTGYRARESAARLREARYETTDEVRAARDALLKQFHLRRRLSAADERVAAAREKLQRVNVDALQAELEAALSEQASIAEELSAAQEQAATSLPDKSKVGRKAGRGDAEAIAAELTAH